MEDLIIKKIKELTNVEIPEIEAYYLIRLIEENKVKCSFCGGNSKKDSCPRCDENGFVRIVE